MKALTCSIYVAVGVLSVATGCIAQLNQTALVDLREKLALTQLELDAAERLLHHCEFGDQPHPEWRKTSWDDARFMEMPPIQDAESAKSPGSN